MRPCGALQGRFRCRESTDFEAVGLGGAGVCDVTGRTFFKLEILGMNYLQTHH